MLFLPQDLYTKHHGVRGRGFSPAVVAVASQAATSPTDSDCVDGVYRSMSNFGSHVSSGSGVLTGQHQEFGYAITTTGSIVESATERGVASFKTVATDAAITYLKTNGGVGAFAVLGSHALAFETAITQVSSTARTIIAGLVGPAETPADIVGAAATLAGDPFVGFLTDGTTLYFSYKAAGETKVDKDLGAIPVGMVALGITMDPNSTSEALTVWVNNERVHTLSKALVNADAFPKVGVCGIVGMKAHSAAVGEIKVHRIAAIAPV
jgi:hypothetical protein